MIKDIGHVSVNLYVISMFLPHNIQHDVVEKNKVREHAVVE